MPKFPHTQFANRVFSIVLAGVLLVGCGFCVATVLGASAPAPVLPPLPTTMPTAVGPLEVQRVVNLMCNGHPSLGCFSGDERYLAIRDSIPLIVAYQAYFHEGVHVAFYYGAIQFKSEAMEDQIADVIANQTVMYMLSRKP